jgi:pyruvate formate lyase activating enzyme
VVRQGRPFFDEDASFAPFLAEMDRRMSDTRRALIEARFYEQLPNDRVHCMLCPHHCRIADGARGLCGVRIDRHGKLFTLVYDRVISRNVEPVEKKPLFHFLPGADVYSIGTVGCNLRCRFCQNWEVSQWPGEHLPAKAAWSDQGETSATMCPVLHQLRSAIPGERVTPRQIVDAAVSAGASAVAYTYTEPTIFYELAYDTATVARAAGLKNLFITNGYISEEPLRQLADVLDAVNVDLKFLSNQTYRHLTGGSLQPVLDAIRLYRQLGLWVELTTLIIPGVNDSEAELRRTADFIRSVGPEVPWHISRFHPAYEMRDAPRTPTATLQRACQIGREAGLRYVYVGNVPGEEGENTHCHRCGSLLIERYGFIVRLNRVRQGKCPDCGEAVDGVSMDGVGRSSAAHGDPDARGRTEPGRASEEPSPPEP